MGYSSAQAKAFISQIAPLIVAEGKKRGYKVFSTVIAQAIIESASNTSILGYKYFNYFGLKCGSAWKGASINLKTKEEYTVGVLTNIRDNFRVYFSMEAGVAGYYDFISTKRYSNLKTAETYVQYAERLKADGYATSSTYVNTLVNTVKKYDLTKYDSGEPVVTQVNNTINANTNISANTGINSNEEIAREVIDGKWGNGTDRRNRLTQAGYNYSEIQALVNKLLRT